MMGKQEISVWEIDLNTHSQPKVLERVSPEYEEKLETLLAINIDLLENGLLVIGRQSETPSGPLDLLCMEETGSIVVIELKKNRLLRKAVVQAIDYASQISAMDEKEFKEFVEKGVKKDEESYPQFDDLYEFIHNWEPDFNNASLNNTQRIVLVGCKITDQTEKMVSWLSACGVNINAYEFPFFKTDKKTILARRVIISQGRLASGRAEVSRKRPRPLTPEKLLEIAEKNGTKEIVEELRKIRDEVDLEDTTQSNFGYVGMIEDERGKHHQTLVSVYPSGEEKNKVGVVIMYDEKHLAGYCKILPNKVVESLSKFNIKNKNDWSFSIQIKNCEEAKEFVEAIKSLIKTGEG